MRYPAFLADAVAPANRSKLRFGIYTGYALAAGFALLAGAAVVFNLTPWKWAFIGLISTKVLTNSIAWLAIVRDRAVFVTQAINSTSDVILLTGAIYFTGGPYSPLIATYVVVISAVALLSNVGVTWLAISGKSNLPRWLGVLGAVVMAEQAIEMVTIFGSTGFTAPGGAMNMQLGAGLYSVWLTAFIVFALRHWPVESAN